MRDHEELADEPSADESSTEAGASRGCGVVGCVILVVMLVALGFGAATFAGAVDPILDRFRTPDEVVREYMLSYEDGDRERAARFLCQELRTAVGAGPLRDPVAALEPEGASWRWRGVEDESPYPREGGRVAIYYEIDQPGTGARRTGQALLANEDGWRICAFGE